FRAGRARNLGAKFARSEILCFLDSDILIPENYLLEVKEGLRKSELVQAVRFDLNAGYITLDEVSFKPLSTYWEKFSKSAKKNWNLIKHPWKYICTHSLSVSKSLFIEMGGFSSLF